MPIYQLPAKPAIVDAIAAGQIMAVHERLTALALAQGYVLGDAGIAIHADGSVSIDAGRDPSADWEAFDPTEQTADEVSRVELRRQVRQALSALDADIERLGDGQGMTVAQARPILLRTDRVLAGLIRVLIDLNLIEREDE